MTSDRPPIEQLLDVVLYAPIGAAVEVQRRLPELVKDGRQKAEQRVVLARFIGKMAVHVGRQELDKRIAALWAQRSPATDAVVDVRSTEAAIEPVPVVDAAPNAEPVDVADLAVAGYDSLSASQVVGRLGVLSDDELAAIEAYESANRRRRTILAKIAQLRSREG